MQQDVESTAKQRLDLNLQVARLSAIIDSSFEGIITINADQRIISFNKAASDMFGYSSEEIVGQPLDALIPERFRAGHPTYVHDFKDSSASPRAMERRAEISGRRKDGSEFQAEITIAKIDVGDSPEFSAFIRDISQYMKLIEGLRHRVATDP